MAFASVTDDSAYCHAGTGMTLVRNSLHSLTPTLVGVAVSILTVPFYVSLVGVERYGALLLAFVLLGYFGQADFGLGRAITQRLSSMRDAQPAERAGVVWSAIMGAALISVLAAAILYLAANLFFQSYFDADAALKAEVLRSTWLFALCVPVIIFTGVASGSMAGLERFGVVSGGTSASNILSQILPLVVAVSYTVEFSWLVAASLFGRVIGLIPILISMILVFLRGQPANPSMEQLRPLLSFGSWIMVTAIVGPLMVMADRVVIGAVLGAAAVVAYTVPVQIALRTVMFPAAVVQVLFPRLASSSADEALELGRSALVVVGQLYGLLVIGLICLAAPLLELWLGDNLDPRSVLVGQITLIGFWTNALANIPYSLIQARGNSRFTAVLHVCELPIYGGMLYALGTTAGLYGVALAFTARAILDSALLLYKAQLFRAAIFGQLAGPALLIAAATVTSQWLNGWPGAILAAGLYCTILLFITWLQLPDPARRWLDGRLAR